jgi:hypothetical protein
MLADSYGLTFPTSLHRVFMNKEVLRRDCNKRIKLRGFKTIKAKSL